jgi:hypothetical protein
MSPKSIDFDSLSHMNYLSPNFPKSSSERALYNRMMKTGDFQMSAGDPLAGFDNGGIPDSGFYAPSIPVDIFNEVVWNNYANPLGTKDPYGDNEQPLRIPAPIAAATTGLLAGTSAMTGQPVVSPYQVAMTSAAMGTAGYAAGSVAGRMLGALAGLSPESQKVLQQTGMWGGLLTGAISPLFNR